MKSQLRVYNTATKSMEEFSPLSEGEVKMYVCGPTVYDLIHVGNARPLVVFDVLHRYLEYMGYKVTFVQNITDIDDRMIIKAAAEGVSVSDLARRYIAEFKKDANDLHVFPPDVEPRATGHISDMIDLIEKLEAKGLAYKTDDGVYFDTAAYADYGKLSGRNLEELQAGARIEVDENKKNPMDFALWKSRKPGEPFWPSPWGDGRPGWHIECSAMSMKYLGETFDIHGGGADLVFPHHENEAAQSEGATGKPFARYWMHNGYININNQKMSKSLGNFQTIRDVGNEFDLEVLRFFLLSVHYRHPVNFSHDMMEQAKAGLDRLYGSRDRWAGLAGAGDASEYIKGIIGELHGGFTGEMDNDLNTAAAIGELFKFITAANAYFDAGSASAADFKAAHDALMKHAGVLGLLYRRMDDIPADVMELAAKREKVRAARDWKMSDEIRDEINARGYVVEDTPAGQKVRKA